MIAALRDSYPVRLMCRALDVSPSGFYAAQRRAPSRRRQQDRALTTRIRVLHHATRRTYGSPRIHAELRAAGVRISRKRVARLMRDAGLVARHRRHSRYRRLARQQWVPPAPNRLGRRFAPGAVNRVGAADLTYLRAAEGWLYLAVVLDVGSRRIVGWALQTTLDLGLPLRALRRALARRRPAPGWVHHSDQGGQYLALDYHALIATHGGIPSMSERGAAYDNAVVESFFASLKTECLPAHGRLPRAALIRTVAAWIEDWYNRRRRHSSLGYRAPAEYEAHSLASA